MAQSRNKDKDITMTFVKKAMQVYFDKLPDVSKKTGKVQMQQMIDTLGTRMVAQFDVLADHLVSDKQTCNKCGNEVYFDRYATYPWAKVDLPENFGKPVMSEQVYQFDPKEYEDG